MTSEQFTYWLQGFVELNGSEPTPEQWQGIKDHLQTVFIKVTPKISTPQPAGNWPMLTKGQEKLVDRLHQLQDLSQVTITC